VDAERVALRARVNEMFNKSRSSAGSRTIQGLLNDQGIEIGRFSAPADGRVRPGLQAARTSRL